MRGESKLIIRDAIRKTFSLNIINLTKIRANLGSLANFYISSDYVLLSLHINLGSVVSLEVDIYR